MKGVEEWAGNCVALESTWSCFDDVKVMAAEIWGLVVIVSAAEI